jgi:hypothetical protein
MYLPCSRSQVGGGCSGVYPLVLTVVGMVVVYVIKMGMRST